MNDRVMGESAEVPSVRKVHKVPHGITPAAKKALAAPSTAKNQSLDKRTPRERVLYGQGVYFTDQPPKSIALLGHCNRCCLRSLKRPLWGWSRSAEAQICPCQMAGGLQQGQGDDREHTLRPEPLRHSHP